MLKIIFLLLYLTVTAIHLYGSAMRNQKLRNATKPFLMIFLGLFYGFSGVKPDPLVMALIVTSWLGDVLLMLRGMKWFTTGGLSFLATHVLLVILYLRNISWGPMTYIVVGLYLIIGSGILLSEWASLKRYLPKGNLILILTYLGCNITMNLFAAMQAVSNLNRGSGLILLGSLLFLASDTLLFLVRFDKKQPFYGQHFNVMLTYSLAKLMIVLGFIFA